MFNGFGDLITYSEDNSINNFQSFQRNKLDIHLYTEFQYNKYQNNSLFESNFDKTNLIKYENDFFDEKSRMNFPLEGIEVNSDSNKNEVGPDASEVFGPKEIKETPFFNLNNICCNNKFDTSEQNLVKEKAFNYNSISKSLHEEINFINLNPKEDNSSINNRNKKLMNKNDVFIIDHPKLFKIFHPGSFKKYPRDLINLISENKIDIPLSKRNKKRKRRKNYPDLIRKKIKVRFLKALKNTLNERLKYAGSKLLFDYLPQAFVKNISKKKNRGIIKMTFREVFSKDFSEYENKDIKVNKQKYKYFNSVFKYIEENEIISEKSNYNYYKKMKYINLALNLNDFFSSDNENISSF